MPNHILLTEAAQALTSANRVLVVGCSGGGKTTLSRRIATEFGLPFQSLDHDAHWQPGWIKRGKDAQRAIIERLASQHRWVMDGSGASTFDIRLPRADLVIWMRVPRYVALAGLTRRVVRTFGTVRPEMAEGCPEHFPDREFLSYIWNFEKIHAPKFVCAFDLHGPNVPVAVVRSHRELDRLFSR